MRPEAEIRDILDRPIDWSMTGFSENTEIPIGVAIWEGQDEPGLPGQDS